MSEMSTAVRSESTGTREAVGPVSVAAAKKPVTTLNECVVEIISDSGEGAQRCGQSFGAIAARMGNGIWTVEIIPAEIQPPRTQHRRRQRQPCPRRRGPGEEWRRRGRSGRRFQ
jgi:hypothetical protein